MNLNDILTWSRRLNIYIEITCDTSCSSTRRKSWCTNLHFYAFLGFNILKKFSGNKEETLVNFWLYFCMVCIHLWPIFHHYIRWEFKCHSKRCITLNHCRSLLSPLFLQPWLLNCPKTHCDWLIVLFMYNSYLNCVLHWNNTDRQTVSP